MSKSRVVIASPSLIDLSRIEKALDQAGAFETVARTADLSATYSRVEELMPDFVVIAEGFTHADEYQCMQSLFRAVESRVVTIYTSPKDSDAAGWMAQNKEAIHPRMEPRDMLRVLHSAPKQKVLHLPQQGMAAPVIVHAFAFESTKKILIGASTGGIDALTTILRHFPKDCPPTAIVQHTGQNFSETLVRLLDRNCVADVVLAETGLEMQPGRIVLAGGIDGHLKLEHRNTTICKVVRGPATSGHLPSIDEMFMSAIPFAAQVIAVLLTGMGRDGATGLLNLRQAGATTIGQDQATSVVYGMPRVAHELGAVQYQMALPDIGPAILDLCASAQAQPKRISR